MKKELVNHLTWLANKVAEPNVYKNWSDDLKVNEMEESFQIFYDSLIKGKHIDLEKLTVEEAKELRFCKWDTDTDLWLFPLWIVPIIPEGMEVTFISGETKKYKRDEADNDIRYGCVAYGIMIKEGEQS